MSASFDRRSKIVLVQAVVVPELEFRDVERQIFLADFVEASHDATLDERPEAFDGLLMDRADNVLTARMVNKCTADILWRACGIRSLRPCKAD